MNQHKHLDLQALAKKHNKTFIGAGLEGNLPFVYLTGGGGRTIYEGDPDYQKARALVEETEKDNPPACE